MSEHSRGPYNSNLSEGAIYKHNNLRGHAMDLQNPTKVFQSDCSFTRETVEAALMFVAPTIKNNTASASTNSNQMVASMICKSTKLDWEKLSTCIPHLDEKAIPPSRKYLFGNPGTPTQVITDEVNEVTELDVRPDPTSLALGPVSLRTRSSGILAGEVPS